MAQEIEDIASLKLPEALKQLKGGYEAMEKIARYCHGAQKKKEYQQIYMQSQDYSKDALTNAAYHVNAIGIHLTQFLTLQAERVEQLDIHIKILTDVRHEKACRNRKMRNGQFQTRPPETLACISHKP